jgi:hypothetical protein
MVADVQRIARALTPGQRSTLLNLDDIDFCILGCAEQTALRLSSGGARRPPLVELRTVRQEPPSNAVERSFRLNDLGVRVKAALARPT